MSAFQRGGGPFVVAVEATRMPMVVTDPTIDDDPIVYVNQSFIDLFGYSREEVLGQTCFFLTGPNTDPEVERHIRAAMIADEPLYPEVSLRPKMAGRSGRRSSSALFTMPREHDPAFRVLSGHHPPGQGRAPYPERLIEGNRRTRIAVRFPAAVRSSINSSPIRLVSKEPLQSPQVTFTSVRAASTLPEKGICNPGWEQASYPTPILLMVKHWAGGVSRPRGRPKWDKLDLPEEVLSERDIPSVVCSYTCREETLERPVRALYGTARAGIALKAVEVDGLLTAPLTSARMSKKVA